MWKNGWKKREVKKSSALHISYSDTETREIALALGAELEMGSVICLSGDLGAGKTTFVKGIAEARGISPLDVTSPTYTYLHLIETLAHFDLYRLQGREQFFSMGFDEYLEGEHIVCIEWPEVICPLFIPHYWVKLAHFEGKRKIEITWQG